MDKEITIGSVIKFFIAAGCLSTFALFLLNIYKDNALFKHDVKDFNKEIKSIKADISSIMDDVDKNEKGMQNIELLIKDSQIILIQEINKLDKRKMDSYD